MQISSEEYVVEFKEATDKMTKIVVAKSNDYAGTEDAFRNFRLCEYLGVCSAEKGLVVRMSDKLSRISNLLESDPKVVDEKIKDTLIDLANYSIILSIMIKKRRGVVNEC